MKKLAFLMMAAACFILTACPSGQPENVNGENENTEVTETTDETEIEQQDEEELEDVEDFTTFARFHQEFEVNGTPDIESFYKAMPFYYKDAE